MSSNASYLQVGHIIIIIIVLPNQYPNFQANDLNADGTTIGTWKF